MLALLAFDSEPSWHVDSPNTPRCAPGQPEENNQGARVGQLFSAQP